MTARESVVVNYVKTYYLKSDVPEEIRLKFESERIWEEIPPDYHEDSVESKSPVVVQKRNIVTSFLCWAVASNNGRARRLLLFDLISLAVLIPLAFIGTTLGMKAVAQELPTMTVLAWSYTRILQLALMAFALTLDIGILTWTAIRLQYHVFKWLEWHRKNCTVHLLGYPEPQTSPTVPIPHVSSPTVREIKF